MATETTALVSKHTKSRKRLLLGAGIALVVVILTVGLAVGLRKKYSSLEFGQSLRKDHFLINSSIAFLNHGSFGAVPKNVLEAQQKYQRNMEFEPVQWIRYTAPPIMKSILNEKLGPFLGVNGSDLAWVENASNGINAICRSLPLVKGDRVVYTNVVYGMVLKCLEYVRDTVGIELIQINITFPTSNEKLLADVRAVLDNTTGVRFAIFDHISSTPALIFPAKELAAMCKQRSIWVMFDGAHALGQIPVNITDIDADFYTANCHKWLYSPKGSAMLYVRRSLQYLIHPTVISFGYGGGYHDQFDWVGTKDFTPYLAAGVAFDWMHSFGFNEIWKYQKDLCDYAGQLMTAKWNTSLYFVDDNNMTAAMVNAKVPAIVNKMGGQQYFDLLDHYGIEVVFFAWNNEIYTRVSCTIYTTKQDIEKYVNSLVAVIEKFEHSHPSAHKTNGLSALTTELAVLA